MSEFDFDFNKQPVVAVTTVQKNGATTTDEVVTHTKEMTDPNSIVVQLTEDLPTIILWGPASCGKSIFLIRLARYLSKQQYQVKPVLNFRPDDKAYVELCKNFQHYMTNHIAPGSTGTVNFQLLQIASKGKKIAQILEAPGEHYFNPAHPEASLPTYLATIVQNDLPKIYIFFLEISWSREADRANYAEKIADFLGHVRSKDGVILLCNKSDYQSSYIYNGMPEKNKYLADVKRLYPQIFNRLGSRKGFSLSFLASRPYDFAVFSSGEFKDRNEGGQTFVEGRDLYPRALWEKILKNINGSWF